ncbi:MAG: hypothetical protein JRJ65_21170 [Deltaproteobacteria bacterium]|nr:hypothetical protein [Deltaproteobacteria bacterium]
MKTQKLLVIVASVCLMAFFTVSSFAETDKKTLNVDIYAIASALEDVGLEVVETEENSLKFIAPNGEAVIIKSNPERKKVTVTVDGNNEIMLDANDLTAIQLQGNDLNLVECIILALEIYGLRLDLCKFDTGGDDPLCVPEATFGFALDILRCVQFVGDLI